MMANDERAIRDLMQTWQSATKSGDVGKVMSLMDDDVVFVVAGRAPFGRAEFEATLRGMSGVGIDGRSEIEEVKVIGDWAFARAHLTLDITPSNGAPLRRSGYTLSIFRKEPGGKWVLARDANLLTTEANG